MKRLLLILAVLAFATVALANDQREILLTNDGTLFVAEQQWPTQAGEVDSTVMTFIRLTIRKGEDATSVIVPGTREPGLHKNPALAYDEVTGTLFVFWQRSASLLHSELLFQTMNSNLEWSPAVAFGDGRNYRENLRIAVTRKADAPTEDGTGTKSVPQINVHAVWWETDSWDGQESAQYAMLSIENGAVVETSIHPLLEFVDADAAATRFVADSVPEVYKHPSLFPSPQQDSVLVLFGEIRNESMNRVRIRPSKIVGNARVHIPVGKAEGGTSAPRFDVAANSRVGVILGGDDRIAMYTTGDNHLSYIVFRNGQWGSTHTVQLDSTIASDSAVNAVRRLVEHE